MKHLIFMAGLALAVAYPTAYAKEEPKKPVPAEQVDKKPETKRVCVMQKDAKTGKEKEVCKNVKIHKKYEGTKVPDKAPAKAPAKKDEKK